METRNFGQPIILIRGSDFQRRMCLGVRYYADVQLVKGFDALLASLAASAGATIILELSLVDAGSKSSALGTLFKRGTQHKIIVVTEDQSPDDLYQLFKQGARGFFPCELSADLLLKAVQAVQNGELWIGRKLTGYLMSRVIVERGRRSENVGLEQTGNDLTPRELEIARYVAKGKCDKVIARELSISHHTVKNHMSSIFNKLQVTDRYQLALVYHGIDVN